MSSKHPQEQLHDSAEPLPVCGPRVPDPCPTCLGHRPNNLERIEYGDGKVKESWMSEHTIHVSDMKASYQRGCEICSLVYRGIAAVEPDMVKRNSTVQWVIEKDHIRLSRCGSAPEGEEHWFLRFYAVPGKPAPWGSLQPTDAPVHDPDFTSDSCFAQVQSWLTACNKKHKNPKCRLPAVAPLPRRVIDLGLGLGTDNPRLYESHGEVAQYVALSHCWGSQQNYTTTKETLELRKRCLPFLELPKTFQNAIFFTWKLHIRYLWVDSLCIVQDDKDDWETEAAKMCDIYANAYVTVVASIAGSDREGFLRTRPQSHCGILVDFREGSGQLDVKVQKVMRHTKSPAHGMPSIPRFPLDSRAWALQEDILSRRTVSYHDDEIVWECGSGLDCECNKINYGPAATMFKRAPLQKMLHFKKIQQMQERYIKPFTHDIGVLGTYETWRSIVPNYTARKLTKPSDSLPALSGVAAEVHNRTHDIYLAGIWKNDLQREILWHCEATANKLSTYRAPSFSWASVEGLATYRMIPFKDSSFLQDIKISVLDARCVVDGSNPTGEVSSGFLRLRGTVCHVTLQQQSSQYSFGWKHSFEHFDFYPDTNLCQSSILDEPPHLSSTVQRADTAAHGTGNFAAPVCCLVVADLPHGEDSSISDELDVYYLLVLGRSTNTPGAYERVGLLVLCVKPEIRAEWLAESGNEEIMIV